MPCGPLSVSPLAGRWLTGTARALIETSTGEGPWALGPSANVGNADNVLNGVSCPSTTTCVAVGFDGAPGATQSLVEALSGTTWVDFAGPDKGHGHNVFDGIGDNVLDAVSCTTTFCVAVGYYYNASHVAPDPRRRPHGLGWLCGGRRRGNAV